MKNHMWRATVVLAGAGLLGGCESGPSGPGNVDASVESVATQFGAAVLEVQGPGITGFEGRGSTFVFWSPMEQPNRYRVVVVSPEGSNSIPIRIGVQDLAGPAPQGTVIEASGLDDEPLSVLSSFSVRFAEP